jgi:AraC-like DNA-binding protein
MTASVNLLTDRARRPAAKAPPTPMQPVSDLRVFLEAFGRLGYDVEDLRGAAGLSAEQLSDPDGLVPVTTTPALFGRAQAVRPIKNLALRLALETPFGAFPLLDHLVGTSATVGDALGQLRRYFRLVCAPLEIEIREDEDPIRVVYSQTCVGPSFSVEYSTALAVTHMRREAAGPIDVVRVRFVQPPEDPADFAERLRCAVLAPADWNGFDLTRASWSVPLRRRDAALHDLLAGQADAIVSRRKRSESASDELRHALAVRVARGDAEAQTLEAVARQLAMSPRKLQRRLADEGSSFQEILAETRREAAERFLAESALSAAEVGYLLGYSEPAAFHRAFKRWYGVTPVAYRRKARA